MSENGAVAAPSKRVPVIDIIKGLGIIGVVLVHSCCPAAGVFMLYLIVMFFMASGFFWNEKKTHTWKDTGLLILKRFKSLYVPYFIAKVTFALFRNVFIALHLLPAESALSVNDIPRILLSVVICGSADPNAPNGGEYFSVTMWFLAVMFFVYAVHAVICRIFDKLLTSSKNRATFYIGVISAVTLILWLFLTFTENAWFIRFFACYAAFLFGIPAKMVYDRTETDKIRTLVWVILLVVSFGALIAIFVFTGRTVDVAKGELHNVTFYYLCGLAGFLANFSLAVLISRGKKGRLARGLCYLGRNTLPIMTLHLIFFKPVCLIYILLTGMPTETLEMFPVVMDMSFLFMWIFYVPAGIGLSLLVNIPYQKVKALILKPRSAA